VVKSLEELDNLQEGDTLVFVTLGMRYKADEIKKKHPKLRVIITTGLLPEDEAIVVQRTWLTPEFLLEFASGMS